MHIELLWIIPIVAFGIFLFLIAFLAQKRSQENLKSRGADLSSEVARFNSGAHYENTAPAKTDGRISDLENAIGLITQSLSSQQKVIDRFQQENNEYNSEISELKKKLRDLNKEYDIMLSENYSLRAKIKKLLQKSESEHLTDFHYEQRHPSSQENRKSNTPDTTTAKQSLKLYEDTRLLSVNDLDDTSEFEVPQMGT